MEWVLHILGVVLWLGALLAAGLVRGPEQPGQPSTRRRVLNTLALPGLVLTVLAGLGLMAHAHSGTLTGWFHVKLTLAAVLVVLHVLMARGRLGGVWFTPVVGLLGLAAITLAHLKPF
jgi:uncharacterized membrane protein